GCWLCAGGRRSARCTSGYVCSFFVQAEDGIRGRNVTGVQTCALPISTSPWSRPSSAPPAVSGSAKPPGSPCPRRSRSCSSPWPKIGRASCREREQNREVERAGNKKGTGGHCDESENRRRTAVGVMLEM